MSSAIATLLGDQLLRTNNSARVEVEKLRTEQVRLQTASARSAGLGALGNG